jgi:hypothetical protein
LKHRANKRQLKRFLSVLGRATGPIDLLSELHAQALAFYYHYWVKLQHL